MTDRPEQNFDENDIRRLVKNLPPVEADPAFRDRLRSSFATGRIDESREYKAPAREGTAVLRWLRWAVPAAAAAVVLLTIFAVNTAPSLRILAVTGSGDARLDGRAVALSDLDALAAGVRGGADVEIPAGANLDLVVNDVVLFEVTGGTHMTIPPAPGKWFARAVACSLFVGELRVKTGKNFPGSELQVFTPEGIVEITATMLSIQRDAGGTCVCVLEGVALVGVDERDMEPVKPGFRKVMASDGASTIIPVLPLHRDGVLDFDKRVGKEMKPHN